jgi:hypothetical protein
MDQPDATLESAEQGNLPEADHLDPNPNEPLLDDDGNPVEPAEEDAEIEIDGKKFALPKTMAEKLESERMMHRDYTQKTQSVAETRRSLEKEREQFQKAVQFQQDHFADLSALKGLEAQLKQFEGVNWAAYTQQDPIGSMNLERQYRDLQAQHAQATNTVTQRYNQRIADLQQETAKQIEQSGAYLERVLPNAETRIHEVMDYAEKTTGIKRDDIRKAIVANPALAVAFHKAELFDRVQAKTPQKATPPATPVTRIAARSSGAQKDPEKMTGDEWLKWRNAQVSKKR